MIYFNLFENVVTIVFFRDLKIEEALAAKLEIVFIILVHFLGFFCLKTFFQNMILGKSDYIPVQLYHYLKPRRASHFLNFLLVPDNFLFSNLKYHSLPSIYFYNFYTCCCRGLKTFCLLRPFSSSVQLAQLQQLQLASQATNVTLYGTFSPASREEN